MRRCIQEYSLGFNAVSVIGEVINNAVTETIASRKTQTRPTNLCCLVPFLFKKINKPSGTAIKANDA
jgi:hypothetical protein